MPSLTPTRDNQMLVQAPDFILHCSLPPMPIYMKVPSPGTGCLTSRLALMESLLQCLEAKQQGEAAAAENGGGTTIGPQWKN